MKPIFIICLTIFLSTGFLQAKEIVPQVKEEIELMSALARLAGYEEFPTRHRRQLYERYRLLSEKISLAQSR